MIRTGSKTTPATRRATAFSSPGSKGARAVRTNSPTPSQTPGGRMSPAQALEGRLGRDLLSEPGQRECLQGERVEIIDDPAQLVADEPGRVEPQDLLGVEEQSSLHEARELGALEESLPRVDGDRGELMFEGGGGVRRFDPDQGHMSGQDGVSVPEIGLEGAFDLRQPGLLVILRDLIVPVDGLEDEVDDLGMGEDAPWPRGGRRACRAVPVAGRGTGPTARPA